MVVLLPQQRRRPELRRRALWPPRMLSAVSRPHPVVHRNAIRFRWHHEHEQQQRKARDHVRMKLVQRLEQEMPEGYEYEHSPQGVERRARPKADQQQSAEIRPGFLVLCATGRHQPSAAVQ